eukprot:5474878-Prymnesium_polylepis.1
MSLAGKAAFGAVSLTSASGRGIFVARVGSGGAVKGAVLMGGPKYDHGYSIASDGAGGALVTGTFEGTAAFGSASLTSAGGEDVFVARVGPGGTVLWAVQMGGPHEDN